MARLVSTALVKGLVRSCRLSSTAAVSQPVIQQFVNCSSDSDLGDAPDAYGNSTTSHVAADMRQDFQLTRNIPCMSLQNVVAQDVNENPVMIYMKGRPDAPSCGFSALAVKVLQQYGVPIASRDILTDFDLKASVKAYTDWPTFPQIFIKGEFIGGSDIILHMHQQDKLKYLLDDNAHNDGHGNGHNEDT